MAVKAARIIVSVFIENLSRERSAWNPAPRSGETGPSSDAARSLRKFAGRVDTSRWGEPAALGVIVERGYGYARPDGVSVIPLGTLGP